MRFAGGVAKWKIAEKAKRVMANRAVGYQYGGSGAILLAARQDVRAVDLQRMALAAVGRRAVKAARKLSYAALSCLLAQQRQWKPATRILHAGVLTVNGHVRDAQVIGFLRFTRVDLEELCGSVVSRTRPLVSLVRLIRCRRSDQGDT